MMNVQEPPKVATESATRSPSVTCPSMTSLGWRLARTRTSCWEAWNWWPEYGEHVHAGVRLALDQDEDVVAVHLDADGLFGGDGLGLMGRLLEHGGEAEEIARGGLVTTTS